MKILLTSLILAFSVALHAQAVLKADGPGDTYELIKSVLAPGQNPIEVPDCSHPDFGRHIDEIMDTTLNEYVFKFFIHVVPDDDRCINQDRQRNEIKVYNESPDSLKGFEGDVMEYSWRFKLDQDFQPSTSFTHIHQLKAVGGNESSMPVITLTPRKASPDKLELRYAETTSQETLKAVDLSLIKGRWMSVSEKVKYGETGSYEISIKNLATGNEVFHYKNDNIRMWRTGASFIRPKWGIYRSLKHPEQLRDEQPLFNEFIIKKHSSLSVGELNHCPVIIYPNPASNVVCFKNRGENHAVFVKLSNSRGKTLLNNQGKSLHQINIANLPKGIYFVEFNDGGKHFYRKLIKF